MFAQEIAAVVLSIGQLPTSAGVMGTLPQKLGQRGNGLLVGRQRPGRLAELVLNIADAPRCLGAVPAASAVVGPALGKTLRRNAKL